MWPFKKRKKYLKAGEIGKCIDDREWNQCPQNMQLIYGKSYRVLAVVVCPTCGDVAYDIGGRFDDKTLFTDCAPGHHSLPGMGIHLAGSFRFEKSSEQGETEEEIKAEIEKCIEVEDYEKAHKLQQKIKV